MYAPIKFNYLYLFKSKAEIFYTFITYLLFSLAAVYFGFLFSRVFILLLKYMHNYCSCKNKYM